MRWRIHLMKFAPLWTAVEPRATPAFPIGLAGFALPDSFPLPSCVALAPLVRLERRQE